MRRVGIVSRKFVLIGGPALLLTALILLGEGSNTNSFGSRIHPLAFKWGVVIGALALVLMLVALLMTVGKTVGQRKNKQEDRPREVNVLMLGFAGSGKTLMLAGLFDHFRFGGSGITLRTEDPSEQELERLLAQVKDADDQFLPAGTSRADTKQWPFRVRVAMGHRKEADAFTLIYVDYAGELAEARAGIGSDEGSDEFLAALERTDILMGVLDGAEVRKILIDGSPKLVIKIERLLRLLVRADQRCVHLVISKWDELVDHDNRPLELEEVLSRLGQASAGFKEFRRNPRFSALRVIPVSSFGRDFVQVDNGQMVKRPGGQWKPLNVAHPFYCAIPDILAGDVALMSAHRGASNNHTTIGKERLADMTLAVFALANIVLNVTTHGTTITVPFTAIIERIRKSLPLWTDRDHNAGFDRNAALAKVLEHCYAKTREFEGEYDLKPILPSGSPDSTSQRHGTRS